MIPAADLPVPSSAALEVSDELARVIRAEIGAAGGWLDFARYMELALYAPALGYYSAGSTKLGTGGDFVTAPALGDLLGRALARTLRVELSDFAEPLVLELGAGTGALAAQVLDALGELDVRYRILEPSADLRERQQRALTRFGSRIAWLERLPEEPITGAIIANEVLDALPVSCFAKHDARVVPRGVIARADGFAWAEGAERRALSD